MTAPILCLELDYPLNPNPRYEFSEKTPHPEIHSILASHGDHYGRIIDSISGLSEHLSRIPRLPSSINLSADEWKSIPERYARAFNGDQAAMDWFLPIAAEIANGSTPCWLNGFIPGLDGAALYSFIALKRPALYVEVGSGNSTKFVRQAISDHALNTKIISIDPNPRAVIDNICDEVIRAPLEDCNLSIFNRLQDGDILFVDGSHRCLMNSDATVFFLEVLPRLVSGVLVGIHDIFLPYDYPKQWVGRAYSEQYLLAAYILSEPKRFGMEFPIFYVSQAARFSALRKYLWELIPNMVDSSGTAFWIRS